MFKFLSDRRDTKEGKKEFPENEEDVTENGSIIHSKEVIVKEDFCIKE